MAFIVIIEKYGIFLMLLLHLYEKVSTEQTRPVMDLRVISVSPVTNTLWSAHLSVLHQKMSAP